MDSLDDPQLKLAKLAVKLATTDPAKAEELTRSVTDMEYRDTFLKAVAEKMADIDPIRAERIAKSIPTADGSGRYHASSALVTIAWTVAPTSPDYARRLFDDAEHLAHRITHEHGKKAALELIDKWKTHRKL